MKGVIVRHILRSALVGTILSVAGFGCQNKVLDENKDLRVQNLELQQQLDESNRQKQAQAALPAPLPAAPVVQVSAPSPRQIESTAPPVVESVTPTAPQPKPDMGGLEVTRDLVAGTTTVNLPSDVFFGAGQATLLPEAKKSLGKVITALKKDYAK